MAGNVVDQDRAFRRKRLKPGRGVYGVAKDHPLTFGTDLNRRVARQDPGPDPQLGHPDLLAKQRDCLG